MALIGRYRWLICFKFLFHLHLIVITFRMRCSQGEMYIGHGRLCVCLSVPRYILTLCTYLDVS